MRETISWATLGDSLTFLGPASETIALSDVAVAYTTRAGLPDQIRLRFVIDWRTWRRVDAGGWFHLGPDQRRPPGSLDQPGDPVEIEATLIPQVALTLGLIADDPDEAADWLQATGLNDPMRREAAWHALSVLQKDPELVSVKSGFSTVAFLAGAT